MDLSKYRNKLIGNDDERAVSPVIGVILMVAITVILAAVIAAFVLDIGDLDDSAPNAQFDWETTDSEVQVTLTSGDHIDFSDLNFNAGDGDDVNDSTKEGEEWTAGETIEYEGDDDGQYQIVWESDGSSTVITEYEV